MRSAAFACGMLLAGAAVAQQAADAVDPEAAGAGAFDGLPAGLAAAMEVGAEMAGLGLNLPYWLTHILAWILLIGFTLAHRAAHRKLATEVPA